MYIKIRIECIVVVILNEELPSLQVPSLCTHEPQFTSVSSVLLTIL